MAKSNFIVRGGADFSGIQNEINKTKKNLKGFASDVDSIFSGISQGLGLNLGKLTKVGLIAAATKKLVDFGKQAIEVASDLTEVQNVVDVTFGFMASEINEFASNATKQFGLSELSAKQFASTMGAMLKSSGITGEAVKDMSIELTKLAADMSSFYNLKPDEAFQKIRAGISGETEPLKQLGINMSVANMQAYALSQGIKKQWKEMTQAEQTLLRYNYLLSVTGDAQGDFARNSGSWANQVKLLKEQWQEFMSLIGKALIEILLPIVKLLNRGLELLINIAKAIGSIYTMITGKEVIAETNMDIGDSASDATDSEFDLADGIEKAGKAAKKALAPFDELNTIQNNLKDGSDSSGLFGGIKSGGVNTSLTTTKVDDGLEESKKRWEGFFIKINDWWNNLKQAFAVPIVVPAPVFAKIPSPIYKPDWGLDTPEIIEPVFPEIPNPIYEPNWNLEPPSVPQVIFKPIDSTQYDISLEKIKFKTAEGLDWIKNKYNEFATQLNLGLKVAWDTIEYNYNLHKVNLGNIATGISTTLVANINTGLTTIGRNINNTIITAQNNLQSFGSNIGSIAAETARAWANNIKEGLSTTHQNIVAFANGAGDAIKSFATGMLAVSAEAAKGFVSNIVSGLQTAWDNFKNAVSAMGEKVGGWFSANKKVITTTAIAAGVAIGAGTLALAAPAIIPYVGAALGGLASIPALAKGGLAYGPTLAVIGDNPRAAADPEVISPLSKLQDIMGGSNQAVVEVLNRILRVIESNSGDIVLKMNENELGRATIKALNAYQRATGKSLVLLLNL